MPGAPAGGRRILSALGHRGLLMLSDSVVPSLASIAAGGPIRGSWWGHPAGETIFIWSRYLAGHPDVLETKLLAGKVTYVHRDLWPDLLAVARSRAAWQLGGLSAAGRQLRSRVAREGCLRTDRMPRSVRPAVRELERRLIAHVREVHTERGAHAKLLESWTRWQRRVAPGLPRPPTGIARVRLEGAVAELAGTSDLVAWLPWHSA